MAPAYARTEDAVGSSESIDASAASADLPNAAELYDRHFDFVWRSLRRLGVATSDLEDATQDVFVVVHRRLGEFEQRCAPRTWIFSIAMRTAKAYRRRGAKARLRMAEDESALVCTQGTPEQIRARTQAAELLQRILDHLDDDKRAVFVLAELEHMQAADIAVALGIPINTVYSRLRFARKAFEEILKRIQAKDDWRYR